MDSKTVLDIFKQITRIPRESGHEGPMTDFLQEWAAAHSLECKRDETGNILIIKEATPGKEDIPTLALQGHQDMVCEKIAGSKHDFTKDPIQYEIEDGWMIAKETTLGADDGIGIAAGLALLESDLPMGRIECLFTISEETGMDGAMALQKGFFDGKVLINLDSEEEGEFCIGCAGGVNTTARFHYSTVNCNAEWTRLSLKISGAKGGHSGDDIIYHRLNTVPVLASFLLSELQYGLQLFLIRGGGKHNALSRDCEALIAVPDSDATLSRFIHFGETKKKEYAEDEPDICFTAGYDFSNEKAVDPVTCENLLRSLTTCPHGVIVWSKDIKGLPETSTNLASVRMTEKGVITIVTSQRSSVTEECRKIAAAVAKNFADAGAEAEHFSEYPGWKPNLNSHVLEVCVESYKKLFHKEPIVKAIHAGLECGLFLEKFPGLDMISFGPTLKGVHAPGERMNLKSLDMFVEHLTDVVCNYR